MRQLLSQMPPPKLIVEFCPFLLKSACLAPSDLLNKISGFNYDVNFIFDQQGLTSSRDMDVSVLIDRLLKQRSYVNLFCLPSQ